MYVYCVLYIVISSPCGLTRILTRICVHPHCESYFPILISSFFLAYITFYSRKAGAERKNIYGRYGKLNERATAARQV